MVTGISPEMLKARVMGSKTSIAGVSATEEELLDSETEEEEELLEELEELAEEDLLLLAEEDLLLEAEEDLLLEAEEDLLLEAEELLELEDSPGITSVTPVLTFVQVAVKTTS